MIPFSEGRIVELSESRFEELAEKGVVDFVPVTEPVIKTKKDVSKK